MSTSSRFNYEDLDSENNFVEEDKFSDEIIDAAIGENIEGAVGEKVLSSYNNRITQLEFNLKVLQETLSHLKQENHQLKKAFSGELKSVEKDFDRLEKRVEKGFSNVNDDMEDLFNKTRKHIEKSVKNIKSEVNGNRKRLDKKIKKVSVVAENASGDINMLFEDVFGIDGEKKTSKKRKDLRNLIANRSKKAPRQFALPRFDD